MNADMPFLPADLSVTANTIATSAVLPEELNCFTPLSTKSSPARYALVMIAPASEPACGSGRQKHPIFEPLATDLRYFVFWSSLPNAKIVPQTTEFCTL